MTHPGASLASRLDLAQSWRHVRRRLLGHGADASPWDDGAPVRKDLFGIERLEQHAQSLAAAQPVTSRPPVVLPLHKRLTANAAVLLATYRASAADLEAGRSVVPAAEWLLDNYHLVETQIREIRDDLPPGYYRQLPKLAEGPFAGYPRVFGLAWAFVAHTDSNFDPDTLRSFVNAYQRVEPLTIGELWAVAITLRIVLVENLRRLADEITAGRSARGQADSLADALLEAKRGRSGRDVDLPNEASDPLPAAFAAQLAKRLRDQDPRTTPALGWLEDRLQALGTSIDEAVQDEQQRQGASNVTVRNIITSMRLISDIDWADLFESVSLVDERMRAASAFGAMDFPTRNQYRSAIEELARGSDRSELAVVDRVLAAAGKARDSAGPEAERLADPGYHLIDAGRLALEQSIGFRPAPRLRFSRFNVRLGIGGYVGSILLVTLGLLLLAGGVLAAFGLAGGWFAAVALVGLLPATEAATALVNRVITWSFGPLTLPALDLGAGVPESLRTLVAVPTLLTDEAGVLAQVEQLEVHHLAGAGGDITFALLLDGLDADTEVVAGDAPLLAVASEAVRQLNLRHGPAPCGDRFLLLYRRRVYNPGEGRWIGWERKRGKLHELNRLLRGATDTTFMPIEGHGPWVPPDTRYVITLDADTRLPRDAAIRLVGKMAHPLNRPVFDARQQRVVGGYGILQPRVTLSLPVGREGSLYQRIFSGPGGLDPYAAAVSDVYQDLFGEGSYTGKGIYDVDAFEAALSGRIPDNALLSHDLFEGIFARAGLASDVEVVEEAPSRYDVAAKRQHRWTRGDWQLLPWIVRRAPVERAVPQVGRGKMLDNLRRSLLAPATLLALGLAWLLPMPASLAATLLLLAVVAIPIFLPSVLSVLPHRAGIRLDHHFRSLGADLRSAGLRLFLSIALLPDKAWRMIDAVVRTLLRLATGRHLLEWTTSAQSSEGPRLDQVGFYREMAGGVALGLLVAAATVVIAPASWPLVLPFALSWLAAPALALWSSRAPPVGGRFAVTEGDARELRLTARRTWRYFETFVTPLDNMLPPDNFQESPRPVVAHRTSPTNIGLYLLAAVAARDFGWAGTVRTVERLEWAFESMRKLPRFKGHFLNWYETRELTALTPQYVSSVDSGNLAGHLVTLANACEGWLDLEPATDARRGMQDTVLLVREAFEALPAASGDAGRALHTILEDLDAQLSRTQALETLVPAIGRLADKGARVARALVPDAAGDEVPDLVFWMVALGGIATEHAGDRRLAADDPQALRERLRALADAAREYALGMDFAFLLDPDRKLLSIGFSVADNRLDPSCYDLLASEARLASLFAIAKGDVETRHWMRLGRAATPLGKGSALISWSGSMFEYLMPSLVMRAPAGSLLEQTNRLVVARQMSYGKALGIPWGVSESAYNARDLEFTYQYSNFGVPGLGLKRGLSDNLVIAPYATGLASMVVPAAARRNFQRLAELDADGRYGFYEALDFTRSRLPEGSSVAIVRNYMAHHQGMTIVAIANCLHDGRMRERFHREPMIQACELLLQERMPRDIAIAHPRAEEVKASTAGSATEREAIRRLASAAVGTDAVHLLSNGRYAVMLTAGGGGYSRWRDIAVTRWREDATRDDWGSFVFLRDTASDRVWSAGFQPTCSAPDDEAVVFGEDHAEFTRRDGSLTTTLEVLVSGEDDGEVRRVTVSNAGRRPRDIELTSYAELVLTTPAADNAHPAFAKMFVVTEYLAEYGALLATRRPRSRDEPQVWAAHFVVVEGDVVADPQHESDRARFIGRGRSVADALAMTAGAALSNTVGTVLDPVFSIRNRVRVRHGGAARLAFWTVVAPSRRELLDLVDKHHDRSAFERAKTLAWTQAQVQLRHLGVDAAEAAAFQQLATPLLYADGRFRAPSDAIVSGAAPQSGLWPHSVSGDLPIVLLRIDDIEDVAQVRQLLRAHEYWRMKRLAIDLVILNERASSYVQDLQIAIDTAVRISQSRPRVGDELAGGSVHALRADLISAEARALLISAARVVLIARRGPIAVQLARLLPDAPVRSTPARPVATARQPATLAGPHDVVEARRSSPAARSLEFFNGLGGFDRDGEEYVTILQDGSVTPAPWINVIANAGFGFQVSADGSGYTWSENSRENQLTPWSNDPVTDPAGETFYVRDEVTGVVSSPTAMPIRDHGTYVARHGFGYSRFEHEADDLAIELLQYVPLSDPIKISRLVVRNLSREARRLSVTAYAEWVLGTSRGASAPFLVSETDAASGALLVRNPWSIAFPGRVAFADLAGRQSAWSADRAEFIGRNGRPSAPAGLHPSGLSGKTGAGFDPCAALQRTVELGAGESVEIVSFLGQAASAEEARALLLRYRDADLDAVLSAVTAHWRSVLRAVQVSTPDRAMDIMLNGWLQYQTLACRITARSAFYQASGAYGFRDQLQDGMALTFARPAETRRHLLRAAGRQFVEGDVQHWWLPQSGQGVRTRISDDRVWLAFATATYVACSGDVGVLDEVVPFLDGPALQPGDHDAFFQPVAADESASLFEHCARGLDQCLELTGAHGLPLIGTGDWNDGMNRVGEGGKGESVWLGWLLLRTIALFAPLAARREVEQEAKQEVGRVARWQAHATALRAAIERDAWDGAWYRRATFDDGTWLGAKDSDECRIDSIAQSWAVLSEAAEPARAASAMASLHQHLVRREDRLVLLFTPPFDETPRDPGYIRGYPPGLRENGGQYSHAAMWAILAFAAMRDGERAAELFSLVNPISHASTPSGVERYKVEPYVVAADVYSIAPHAGRGGWTWYTGSAGWMYRAGIEGILGIRREGRQLVVNPCIPKAWPGFEAKVDVEGTQVEIEVANHSPAGGRPSRTLLDGVAVEQPGPAGIRIPLDGGRHQLMMVLH